MVVSMIMRGGLLWGLVSAVQRLPSCPDLAAASDMLRRLVAFLNMAGAEAIGTCPALPRDCLRGAPLRGSCVAALAIWR